MSKAQFTRDCPGHEFVSTCLPVVPRVIAMGDIHGDLRLAKEMFKIAKLMNDNEEWIAEPLDTVVVQVGDQIDDCRPELNNCHDETSDEGMGDDLNVMNFFDNMHKKAKRVGGAVYSLLGNHEILNSKGYFKYVSYKNGHNFYYKDENREYVGLEGRRKAFSPGGPIANNMACTRQSVLIIGSTMYIHAGILPIITERLKTINQDPIEGLKYLNDQVRSWLLNKYIPSSDIDIDFLLTHRDSPFWTRLFGNAKNDKSIECTQLSKKLYTYNIGRLVIGHTPQLGGIDKTCKVGDDYLLFRIDGGFSSAFSREENKGRKIQVLEILNDKKFNIISKVI